MAAELIGRNGPAGLIRAQIRRSLDSHGGLVLVTGEAGIGKTSLVAELVNEARPQGAVVVSGTCWDRAGAPGYWPWVQVVRALEREAKPEEWACASEEAGDNLSFLLGEMSEPPPAGEAGGGDFRLYDAVTTVLTTVSRSRPVIVALDDLHWADPASLRLLDFVVQHNWFERLLVVGTYRDVEVEPIGHPLEHLILPLVAKATTVTLTGLDADEVGALLTRTTGREPDPELVAEVHRRTGGNPFFVEQVARLWQSSGPIDVVPPGIRDAVERRLAHLPQPVLTVLTAAAVLGPEFHRETLAASAAKTVPEVNHVLRQAAMARLVVPLDDGRFGFAHDLVRDALYASLDEGVRRQHHASVVRVIDGAPVLAGQAAAADLAHHAYLAVPDVEPDVALRHLLAAAREASCRLASDEAYGHYGRALELAQAPGRDASTAAVLLDDIERHAAGAGMERIAERARRTRAAVAAPYPPLGSPNGDGAAMAEPEPASGANVFRFDGTVWTLAFGGRTIHLPDAKGLGDLHVLLQRPGTDVPAAQLLAPDGAEAVGGSRHMGGDPVLDETAKARYRERLARLDEEIDRALDRYDDGHAADLDAEREALIEELRSASGLLGRTRRLGDEAERSRKTVTARIRDTLRRIDGRHPELAEHLRASVSTGTTCRYLPATQVIWQL